MGKKRFFIIASALYLFFYMGDAFLSSYYSLYSIHRGLDSHQQSLLLAIIPFALFLGCLVLSRVGRTPKRALWMFRVCALIEASLSFGYAFCQGFVPMLLMTFFLGFFNGAPFALIEGYLVPIIESKGGQYSKVRLFGTLGYIVSLVSGYFILSQIPLQNVYFFSFALFLVSFIFSMVLRYESVDDTSIAKAETNESNRAFFNKESILYFISATLLYGAYNATNYVLPIQLNSMGFSDADYSLARGIAVVAELVSLLLMPLWRKWIHDEKVALYVSAGFIVFATACPTFIPHPVILAYVSMIAGHIGKAFLFAFEALYVLDFVNKKSLSTYLTIKAGGYNLSTSLFNLISSPIYHAWTFPGYFGLLTGLEIIGLICLVLIPKRTELSK